MGVVVDIQQKMNFDTIVAAARECIKAKRVVGTNPKPRFESFHAPSSICSEKVRCVLFMKGVDFVAYDVNIAVQENYQPAYVAMRNLGRGDMVLVGSHAWTGSTSTEGMGFDPLVVPTLVDNLKKKVIVDSKKIMNYLDQELPSPPLYPAGVAGVEKHVQLVDDTPHAGLLYGGDPDNDTRPHFVKELTKSLVSSQTRSLDYWLSNVNLPRELRPLYEAKLKKLRMVDTTLQSKPEVLRNSMNLTKSILRQLNSDLSISGGPWVCGDTLTMADIAWHVSLLRFLSFGCVYLYEDLDQVTAYLDRILNHPILRKATYTWPGFLPFPYIKHMLDK